MEPEQPILFDAEPRFRFRPRLVEVLQQYSRADFLSDLGAGVTVAIVALPLAMAFAIASGVRPEAGLITAVIAGFLISALGGSRYQIGGPTGAFVVLIYGTIAAYGLDNLYIMTLMAGAMLFLMGALRLGSLIEYIPDPVTSGFTSGIAILILSTQIKDFLGMRVGELPAAFGPKLLAIVKNIGSADLTSAALAFASLVFILAWPKKWKAVVPGSIVALILATLTVRLLHLPVETIGTKFGGIPDALPKPHLIHIEWRHLPDLFRPAMTIAMLAAIESLLSAVVADGMSGDRHNSNQELMAQGIANIASPLFGGIPATGAIARTATNIRNGSRSPISGMIHAVVLLAILLAAAPLAKFIPLATLSAILVLVAINMAEWSYFKKLPTLPKSDSAVLLVVFALTVFADLTLAVEVGMALATALFVARIAENTLVSQVTMETETEGLQHSIIGKDVPPEVGIYRVFGAFLFGTTEKLENAIHSGGEAKVIILRLRKVIAMDATGLHALEKLHRDLQAEGKQLILSGAKAQPLNVMRRSGFLLELGSENCCADITASLARAREVLAIQHSPALKVDASAGL